MLTTFASGWVTTTPLSAEHKAKLIGSGVRRGTDLKDVSAEQLAAELSVDVDDARASARR